MWEDMPSLTPKAPGSQSIVFNPGVLVTIDHDSSSAFFPP